MDDDDEAQDGGHDDEGRGSGLCTATRADGSACRARRLPDSPCCWAHAPHLRSKAQAARTMGGAHRANTSRAEKVLPRDLRPLLGLLITGMTAVRDKKMEPAQLSSMAAAAGAVVRLYSVVDADELSARVEALEGRKGDQGDAS